MIKNDRKKVHGDFQVSRGLFVEHIQVDLCEKFQVNQIYAVRCMTFMKLLFLGLNYSATIRPDRLTPLVKLFITFPFIW